MQKRAAEAKARKSAMLATIESRSIKLENTPKKINDKKLYRLILGSDDYKNKLEDKKNAVFLIIDDPSKCPVINEKIINEKNIWFVIIDKKVELTGKVDGTRQIVVVNSKVIIE